jgi:hypothetical protein
MDELDELDHAVALALGGELDGDGWRFPEPLEMYGESFIKTKRSFCRDWSYGGPIIEREGIDLENLGEFGWQAVVNPLASEHYCLHGKCEGPTPLIAAMRAFVASKARDT